MCPRRAAHCAARVRLVHVIPAADAHITQPIAPHRNRASAAVRPSRTELLIPPVARCATTAPTQPRGAHAQSLKIRMHTNTHARRCLPMERKPHTKSRAHTQTRARKHATTHRQKTHTRATIETATRRRTHADARTCPNKQATRTRTHAHKHTATTRTHAHTDAHTHARTHTHTERTFLTKYRRRTPRVPVSTQSTPWPPTGTPGVPLGYPRLPLEYSEYPLVHPSTPRAP